MKRYPASLASDGRIFLWEGPGDDVASCDRVGRWSFGRKARVPTADELKDDFSPCFNASQYDAFQRDAAKAYHARYETVFGFRSQPA